MDEKVYQQEVVPSNPFPGEPQPIALAGQPNPAGTFTPSTTKEKTFPKKRTAVELLSTALNTRSKKILQEFALQDSGGFKVGDYKSGVSGDLRITPNGLTARNIAGLTTFAIDGDTGEAFFLGTIRAGSVISETTIEASEINGGAIDINGNFIVNGDGDIIVGNPVGNISNPSLLFYDNEGTLIGKMQGDTAIAAYFRFNSPTLGNTIFYEDAVALTGEVAQINVDDGLLMFTNKSITVRGTGGFRTPADTEAAIYVDQSGGKDRLMVRFNTGVSQVIATEP